MMYVLYVSTVTNPMKLDIINQTVEEKTD